jgi:hypothetical protein
VLEHLPRPRPSLDDDTAAANAPDNVHLSDAPSGRPSRIGRHLPARLGSHPPRRYRLPLLPRGRRGRIAFALRDDPARAPGADWPPVP